MKEFIQFLKQETGSPVCSVISMEYQDFLAGIRLKNAPSAYRIYHVLKGFLLGLLLAGMITEGKRNALCEELLSELTLLNN